jgi:protein SCO1
MRFGPAVALLASLTLAGSLASGAGDDSQHAHEVIAPAAPIPGESIYQLSLSLTPPDGVRMAFDELRGHPMILTMFYTSCEGVCPLLAFSMRRMIAALPAEQRGKLRAVMVSFDPQRDSPQALQAFAQLHDLDSPQWLIARASESDVRNLAAVLGIRYRELPGGVYSHSAVITLVDAQGIIRAHTTNLNALDPDFMRAVSAELD